MAWSRRLGRCRRDIWPYRDRVCVLLRWHRLFLLQLALLPPEHGYNDLQEYFRFIHVDLQPGPVRVLLLLRRLERTLGSELLFPRLLTDAYDVRRSHGL